MSLKEFITTYPSIAGASFGALVGFLTTALWTFRNENKQKKAVRKVLELEIDNNLKQIEAIVMAFEIKQGEAQTDIYSPILFDNLYIQRTVYERLIVEMSRALSGQEIQEVFMFYGTLDFFKRTWFQRVQNNQSLSKDFLLIQIQQLKLLKEEGNPLTKGQPKFLNSFLTFLHPSI